MSLRSCVLATRSGLARTSAALSGRCRSNCPRMGVESRLLSSQVHLKTCPRAAKAAKCWCEATTAAGTGRDCHEIQSETAPLDRSAWNACVGARHRQLLRCRGYDQLPGAREVHERL